MIALADIVIRSSLLLLCALAVMPLLRRRSAALRHWVLMTALLGAASMPLIQWLVPSWEIVDVREVLPSPVVERVATALEPAPVVLPGSTASGVPAAAASWTTLLFPAWAAGAGLSLSMLLAGLVRLYRVHAGVMPLERGVWQTAAPTAVRVTQRPGLLLVWGIRRPTIIVPTSALTWPANRVTSVLRHELAHVRRHDWMLLVVAETVRALYWFNPLVWIVCARLRTEAELACDDAVITSGGTTGAEYASHVIDIARELTARHWLPAPAIVRQSTLERRVRAMLDKSRNRQPLSTWGRGLAVASIAMASLAITGIAAQSFVSLSGRIVDPLQGVMPGVKMILVNDQTKAKYEIQTDASGRYEFVGLPPGEYSLAAALPGFSQFSARVTVGTQPLQQDLTMSVGTVQETITLTPGAAQPRVTTMDPERVSRLEQARAKRAAACASPQSPDGAPIGGNLKPPLKIKDVRPLYPAALQATGGVVELTATISTSGAVEDIEVVTSPSPELSQAAIDGVGQWQFEPTLLNCEAINTAMTVKVTFATQ